MAKISGDNSLNAMHGLGGARNYRKLKSFRKYLRIWVGGSWSLTELKNTEMTNRARIVVTTKIM